MEKSQAPLDQCVSCHPPHKVFKVAYVPTTPNNVCGACHRKAEEMLARRTTKHSRLACTFCHPDEHQTIKRCVDCHGKPHPEKMLKKFSTCGGCHGVAHSVIR
jgi:predicted CXXCH cytochrome family protein